MFSTSCDRNRQRVCHKKGDTFLVDVSITATDPIDLMGGTLASEIRLLDGTLLATLDTDFVSQDGSISTFTVSAPHSVTENWAVDTYEWDMEFTSATGVVVSSQTFWLQVVKDITNAV